MLPKLTIASGTLVKVTFEAFFKPTFDIVDRKYHRDLKAKTLKIYFNELAKNISIMEWRNKYEQSVFMFLHFKVDVSYCGRDPESPYYTYHFHLLQEENVHHITFDASNLDKFQPMDFLYVAKPDLHLNQ